MLPKNLSCAYQKLTKSKISNENNTNYKLQCGSTYMYFHQTAIFLSQYPCSLSAKKKMFKHIYASL